MTSRHVFVSYSQSDRQPAFGIVESLESHGIDCWIAPRDVRPASDWAEEIIGAIAGARVMVLVFSASANNSPQVRREVERAVHRQVAVLPFRVEDVEPARSLEYFLSSQHWLDAFPPPLEPHYRRLYEHLSSMLAEPRAVGEETPTATAQPRPAPREPVRATLDPAQVRSIEAKLADFMGPVAKLLVKRAEASAASLEALVAKLGAEIESETDRRKFLSACRKVAPSADS
ncbi:MAG: toll/interleukin-1 receptor domain-containing protein [Steroidobacteraceae bacterium]